MNIPSPYLLMLGDTTEPLAIKTARGIHYWRPEKCVGQVRLSDDTVSLGLPDFDIKNAASSGAKTLVLGTANSGGVLAESWIPVILEAINQGLNIASGLHHKLNDIPQLVEAAESAKVTLFDVRSYNRPIKVGTGEKRSGKRLLTVGTDCSVGKMFTTLALEKAMKEKGLSASFCATGQTGILVEGSGIAVDAVVADFISGATEALSPACDPGHWQIVEGQGSLLHPSFSGVTMGLLQGAQPDALVLCHEANRAHIGHLPHVPIPTIGEIMSLSVRLAKLTNPNPRFVGIAVNTSMLEHDEAVRYLAGLSEKYGLPASDPVRFGVTAIVDNLITEFGENA